ncbi:hypothetical protein EW146_g3831 [Bondarzewia mesenterica]|uniref:Zinc/iron permease n=1 Tax=Bondarzewia mesenterica TaxID=1095465 RepID=A0A4S4M250_9AGAM|nr:hypothetical protein EW146_g3831 [Bondarzewia mesenterica]
MSALLALTSFGIGMLPLSFTYSRKHLSQLTSLGTGLLLGTALGVIIPEGIEILSKSGSELPTANIALSLLVGFSIMLLVEQLGSSHVHDVAGEQPSPRIVNAIRPGTKPRDSVDVQFDVELGELEAEQGIPPQPVDAPPVSRRRDAAENDARQSAYPLTVGLVLHGLADGFALGVSARSSNDPLVSSDLSFLVFVALAIHKAPTALAYTTSLLSTSLSRPECRKYLIIFSASTPLGAIVSYGLFSLLGLGQSHQVGSALLVSGGSFLYVATVLQPVSHHSPSGSTASADEVGKKARTLILMVGMFIPYVIGSLLEHGHGSGALGSS